MLKLGDLTWTELETSTPPTLLVPLGATEQHGPHLPLDTDTAIADALVAAATRERRDFVVAPTLQYGSSGEHASFPGTISLGQEALTRAIVEIVRSADWFASVVLVCWHGGNVDVLRNLSAQLADEGRPVRVWQPRHGGADLHAGRTETSLMLYLSPERVRADRPVGTSAPLAAIEAELRTAGVRAVAPNGVLGSAAGASARDGRAIFETLAADLGQFLDER
jgi:mycofactocin system creatininase family protein